MFSLRHPRLIDLMDSIDHRECSEYSYEAIGSTRGGSDALRSLAHRRFAVDHNRTRIGQGDADWERAVAAVRAWKMFDVSWLEFVGSDSPIEDGRAVAVLVRICGLWSTSVSRIVYTIDEADSGRRKFGFAYGTTLRHVECGEERFSVEYDERDGSVWYDLLAFSRPRHWLVRLGRPYARILQKRFQIDSARAMQRAVDIRS